jgi:hypothetical protein
MTAWGRLELLPGLLDLPRRWARLRNGWKYWRAALLHHYGPTWWNRQPLAWLSITCIGICFGYAALALTLLPSAPVSRWATAHPLLYFAGIGICCLVALPGALALLVSLLTPSRGAFWLARHFTLSLMIYTAFLLVLLGYALLSRGHR